MMEITTIRPVWVGDFYRFNVELMDGEGSYVVPVGTDCFNNYLLLQQSILGKTAKYWRLPDLEKRIIEEEGRDKTHEQFFWFRDYMMSKIQLNAASSPAR